MEGVIEQMAAERGAWKFFPPEVAQAALAEVHADTMAAAAEIKNKGECLKKIREEGF